MNKYVDGCENYKFEETNTKCFDCSLASLDGQCIHKSLSPCKYFYFDLAIKACVDCSTTEDKECVYLNIPGCENYIYSSESVACFDCEVPIIEDESCLNSD